MRLFSEQGYTATSIKDIARASRVNSALIYYYFASKEHLFVEALKYSAHAATLHHQRSKDLHDDPIAEINFWFDANAKMAMPSGADAQAHARLSHDTQAIRRRSTV